MARVMVFVDGTWLYMNMPRLAETYGKLDYKIDYGLFPKVLGDEVAKQLRMPEVDIVRTHIFGSYPDNYDLRDEEAVLTRLDFLDMLKEEYHYEVETFPINYFGRRLRKEDRDPNDEFEPKEKCVDIALATSMLYFAAIPHAYDIAIAVVGDRDYIPVLQHVRRLGKRVAIASIKGSCAPEYADPLDAARVKDIDIIWLNDILHITELKYERHQLECQSPLHKGDRKVWTTYRPRKGKPFYCYECRKKFAEQKSAAQEEFIATTFKSEVTEEGMLEALKGFHHGYVEKLTRDRGFGFIRSEAGEQYFFHLTDLEDIEWETIEEGLKVQFSIKKKPEGTKAGAATQVRIL